MTEHIVVYSHGFGVEKNDRGLFTDVSSTLPDTGHVMFDYNQIDAENNTLTVTPLDKQATILVTQFDKAKRDNPEATFDLVCHSQGCVVAALANLAGVRKTIFLAPPARFLGAEAKLKQMAERPGTTTEDGITSYPRRDGSTTIIKADYWASREGIRPIELYNRLAQTTELTIINAEQDEVLGDADFSGLSDGVHVIGMDANHDFTDQARPELTAIIRGLLGNG